MADVPVKTLFQLTPLLVDLEIVLPNPEIKLPKISQNNTFEDQLRLFQVIPPLTEYTIEEPASPPKK